MVNILFNNTLAALMYLAIKTIPYNNVTTFQNDSITTTLSPEEEENRLSLEDAWYMWRCYEPYGCFYIGRPWSGENRPVSTFPERPDRINPNYLLYTRTNRDRPHELKIDRFETIKAAPLKKNHVMYFIIHGFLENGDKTWVVRLMKELLLREDCSVVIVNWIGGAGPPYTQAVANTRLVGAMTARMAAQLIEVGGISPAKMHCIGHSLGGHTAGYFGDTLRKDYKYTLGRITGLDPAEPHFSNTSTMVRLDPTDATFVIAIHTDCKLFISGGLGITQPVAHIDFYPNGGSHQPGCNEGVLNSISMESGSFFRGIRRFLGCNHIRSYEYFIESINSPCPYLAVPCGSWDEFKRGNCFDCVNQYCPRFGLEAQPGNYHASVYLMTGSESPFCKAHYKITAKISNANESVEHGGEVGKISIKVIGENGKKSESIELTDGTIYYEPGSTHTAVVPGDLVGKPNSVEITWGYQASMFNPLTWRFRSSRTYIESLDIKNLETDHEITVCPDDANDALIANEPKILTVENCHPHNVVST